MATEIKAFGCETCPKVYRKIASAKRHEKRCWDNPVLHACRTCDHLDLEKPEPEVGIPGVYFCTEGLGDDGSGFVFQNHCEGWTNSERTKAVDNGV